MSKRTKEEKELLESLRLIFKIFSPPKYYTLKFISPKDWLLITISVIVAVNVATSQNPNFKFTNLFLNIFATLFFVFIILSIIDFLIYCLFKFRRRLNKK